MFIFSYSSLYSKSISRKNQPTKMEKKSLFKIAPVLNPNLKFCSVCIFEMYLDYAQREKTGRKRKKHLSCESRYQYFICLTLTFTRLLYFTEKKQPTKSFKKITFFEF